jgi:hypothetical protein
MMAKTKIENFTYLAIDLDGYTGLGETVKDACHALEERSEGYVRDFTFYRLTRINVELIEV